MEGGVDAQLFKFVADSSGADGALDFEWANGLGGQVSWIRLSGECLWPRAKPSDSWELGFCGGLSGSSCSQWSRGGLPRPLSTRCSSSGDGLGLRAQQCLLH